MKTVRLAVLAVLLVGCATFGTLDDNGEGVLTPERMDRVITVVHGLQKANDWISPFACMAASAYNPMAGQACEGLVNAAASLREVTNAKIAMYEADPTQENARAVVDLKKKLAETWKLLDAQYRGKK